MLRTSGYDVQVANAGIPGDTLRGMLARLDHCVPPGTRLVIVQGGYNDVMAGTSGSALAASIEGILSHLAARRIKAKISGPAMFAETKNNSASISVAYRK